MKYFDYIYFVVYYELCCCFIRIQALCPHPDVPANGKYTTPKENKFEPGDEVIYSCQKGYALSGTDRRICKSNGVWSFHTPFCDRSTRLSNPSVTTKGVRPSLVSRVIDGNTSTCFDWHNATGEYLYLHLNKEMVIRIVMVFLKKGITKIHIFTGLDNDMKSCTEYQNFVETDRWITVRCKNNVLSDTVKIFVPDKKFISVCDVEVYGREEDGCEDPPTRLVPNGHFEVSRIKATLVCEEGFKNEDNRLVCEGNNSWAGARLTCEEILCDPILPTGQSGGEWTFPDAAKKLSVRTRSKLVCSKGYQKSGAPDTVICQRDGTWTKTNATCVEEKPSNRYIIYGAVGAVIVILIISLLATTIHFVRKQRNKEVVVVFQHQSDGSVPLSASEMEYSAPRYGHLPTKVPEFPSASRSANKNSEQGTVQPDLWQSILKKPTVSPDSTFGTMKASTIYGS